MSFCKEILVTFFLLLLTINLNAIKPKNDANDFIPLIVHVMNQHNNDKTGVTFISTTSMDVQIDFIFKCINNNFLRNGVYFFKGESFEKVPQTSVYIVLTNSKDVDFLHNLFTENTEIPKTLKVRSTIILVFMDYPNVDFLKEILKNLWEKNYIYVLCTYIFKKKLYFLSYTAYNASYQQIYFNKYHTDIFEGKTSNIYKNPINVLFTFNDHTKIRKVREYEGINQKYEGKDYDIIKAIFENLNANLTVIDIDDTISDTINNPWFTNLDMENKSDEQRDILKKWHITMLTKSQRDLEEDGVIEVTYPHTDNAITLLVPKRQKISKPVEVYNYLMQPVWLIHLFILTVLVICLSIMRIMSSKSFELEPANQLFRIMITCSSNGFWKKPYEEIFILAWIIWCFLVSIMAQAKITSMLSTDLYESELDSLEDIYKMPKLDFIIFGLNSYIEELSEKYEGSKYMRIISEMVKVPMDENAGEVMLLEMPKPTSFKMSIVLEHDIAKFYARHLKNRQDGYGRPLLHMMKHSIMPCFQVFHVTADSPLLPIINKKIRQLVEGGFIDLYKERFLFKGLIDGYLYPSEDYDIDNYEPTSIDMELAKYAFFLLEVGLLISTVIFIIEHIMFGLIKMLEGAKLRKKHRFLFHNKNKSFKSNCEVINSIISVH